MRLRPGWLDFSSLISTHRDDHLLVGTVSVPIRTDSFAVHAVSEKRHVGRILCSAAVPVTVDNDVCARP